MVPLGYVEDRNYVSTVEEKLNDVSTEKTATANDEVNILFVRHDWVRANPPERIENFELWNDFLRGPWSTVKSRDLRDPRDPTRLSRSLHSRWTYQIIHESIRLKKSSKFWPTWTSRVCFRPFCFVNVSSY